MKNKHTQALKVLYEEIKSLPIEIPLILKQAVESSFTKDIDDTDEYDGIYDFNIREMVGLEDRITDTLVVSDKNIEWWSLIILVYNKHTNQYSLFCNRDIHREIDGTVDRLFNDIDILSAIVDRMDKKDIEYSVNHHIQWRSKDQVAIPQSSNVTEIIIKKNINSIGNSKYKVRIRSSFN